MRNGISDYLSRGHCLLELATTKLPRIDIFNTVYVPGFEPSGQWGSAVVLECSSCETKKLEWDHFLCAGSPCQGNFTCEDDRPLIRELIATYVGRYRMCNQLLAKLSACASFGEYHDQDLPDGERVQTWKATGPPSEWVDKVLPPSYVAMLEASLD